MKWPVFILVAASLAAFGFQAKPKPTFAKNVQPMIKKNCFGCHSGPTAADKIDFAKIKTEADAKKQLTLLKNSMRQLQRAKMPPPGSVPQPTKAEIAAFSEWLKAQK